MTSWSVCASPPSARRLCRADDAGRLPLPPHGAAIRTCVTTEERQANLSRKLARAAQLLRTRVDIDLESQNSELLNAMNERAKVQLRLQQTVEGLSVAAVSYYVLGLLGYVFKAMKDGIGGPDPTIATALALPFVVAGVWWGVRRVRRGSGHD